MIYKTEFGAPFDTGAVVRPEIAEPIKNGELPYFRFECSDGAVSLSYHMTDETVVYGLGEQARGLNKRGWRYESLNTDNPFQNEGRTALYSSHNFLLIDGPELFSTRRVTFPTTSVLQSTMN